MDHFFVNEDYFKQEFLDTNEKLITLINSIPDLILFKDGEGRWIMANDYTLSLFSLEEVKYQGKTSAELSTLSKFHQNLLLSRHEADEKAWNLRGKTRNEVEIPIPGGQAVILDVITTPIFNPDGSRKALVIVGRDITERKRAEEHNYYLAYYDQLTQLPNRYMFEQELEKYLIIANTLQQGFVVMFLDMDRFQYTNDTLGPAIGDQLLIQVSDRLQQCLEEGWFLARLGGDEFAILISNISNIKITLKVAQSIIYAIERPFLVHKYELFITTSIGLCIYPHDGKDAQTLMKNADIALNRAKAKGKNQYQIYNSVMDVSTFKTFSLEHGLNKALTMKEFEIYYQPKIDVRTNQIIGAEALIRWNHPEWNLVPPKEFIPLAEETGLIIPLDDWVKKTVCLQNKEWQQAGLRIVPIAVNISAKQFVQKDFVKNIERLLQESQLNPHCLEIEITETSLIDHEEPAIKVINQLRELGVKVSLDDFGTGYSALSYLKQFKVDTVKIDRAFIKEIGINKQDELILQGIIKLLKSLDINVIAEGVETEEQLHFLRLSDCHQVQGYFYSRPVGAAEFRKLLEKGKIDAYLPIREGKREVEDHHQLLQINLHSPLSADMTIIKFKGIDTTLGKTKVLINNLGLDGLHFVSDIKLAVHPDIILSLETEILGQMVNFIGKVVWLGELEGDLYQYVLQLILNECERNSMTNLLSRLAIAQKRDITYLSKL